MKTAADWHARFVQQVRWTQELRRYVLPRAGIEGANHVLEVGCGTGALTASLHAETKATIYGIDLDRSYLLMATRNDRLTHFAQANAARLPFHSASFDLSICHFLLLWARNPLNVLTEMRRVTRSGGAVVALAEPDYGGRIDYPDPLIELGRLQTEALREQGADPEMGRKLGSLFVRAGLEDVETGLLAGQWKRQSASTVAWELEWRTIEADLAGRVDPAVLMDWRAEDEAARKRGERVLFVPTFYAWGRVI